MCISLDLNGSKIHAIYLAEFLKGLHDDMMQCKRCNEMRCMNKMQNKRQKPNHEGKYHNT